MENLPENHRLPEVDALPDGFLESSSEPPPPSPSPPPPTTTTLNDDIHSTDEPISSAVDVSEAAVAVPGGGSDGHEAHTSTDVEGCLEQNTGAKDKFCAEHESLDKKNLEIQHEAKRRTVKRNSKSEKELLELTLKYQKSIAERDQAVAVRVRLESLCRELQRQNKMLMDECQRVSVDEHNMRAELSTKFDDAIKNVSNKLDEQKNECLSQLKENEMLRNKLKHLSDQYALSEEQFAQKLKQKSLELQLADLKFQQQQEKSTQEQTQMKLYAEQITQLMETEKNLRLQLAADGEKFLQFQEALVKSNEVFKAFKQEMGKMGKQVKELKKENTFLKSKCEKSDVSLIELVEERELLKKQLEKANNQKQKLESLCRSLQVERKNSLFQSNSSDFSTIQDKISSDEIGS
ncbi:hypothetical protein QJS10_CPA03g01271 [Acorus calamus]|uniref:Alpha-taxilin n=1 Tax=Acorus calamus TaxID=4465 RepID=A0AAV9F5M5_ACOCL|nr:hypothetical protein QJS10_CPA03g01271 [Acorus calamus]